MIASNDSRAQMPATSFSPWQVRRQPERAALLISRQARRITPQSWWIRAVKTACAWLKNRNAELLLGRGRLPWDFAGWYFGHLGGKCSVVEARDDGPRRQTWPERDRALIDAANLLVAVDVRAGGSMMELGRTALARGQPVWLTLSRNHLDGTMNADQRELLGMGAEILEVGDDDKPVIESSSCAHYSFKSDPIPSCPGNLTGYLWHYTRASPGPWLGQPPDDYFRALAAGDPESAHDARHALSRILREQKIRACGRLIREGHAVVCLTESTPDVMRSMHRYRPWLLRWDFEPYAVGIRREIAIELGARPVVYCAPEHHDDLHEGDRHLYQKHLPPRVDFSQEKEWRMLGDLDLSRISSRDLAVYCHSP